MRPRPQKQRARLAMSSKAPPPPALVAVAPGAGSHARKPPQEPKARLRVVGSARRARHRQRQQNPLSQPVQNARHAPPPRGGPQSSPSRCMSGAGQQHALRNGRHAAQPADGRSTPHRISGAVFRVLTAKPGRSRSGKVYQKGNIVALASRQWKAAPRIGHNRAGRAGHGLMLRAGSAG